MTSSQEPRRGREGETSEGQTQGHEGALCVPVIQGLSAASHVQIAADAPAPGTGHGADLEAQVSASCRILQVTPQGGANRATAFPTPWAEHQSPLRLKIRVMMNCCCGSRHRSLVVYFLTFVVSFIISLLFEGEIVPQNL